MLRAIQTETRILPCQKCNSVDAVVMKQTVPIGGGADRDFAVICRNHECNHVGYTGDTIEDAVKIWSKRLRIRNPWEDGAVYHDEDIFKLCQWLLANCKIHETVCYEITSDRNHRITIKDLGANKELSYSVSNEYLKYDENRKSVLDIAARNLWLALADLRGIRDAVKETVE